MEFLPIPLIHYHVRHLLHRRIHRMSRQFIAIDMTLGHMEFRRVEEDLHLDDFALAGKAYED